MGPVYRGLDNLSGRRVAIKILRSDLFEGRPEILALFQQEGAALEQLNHPNIVHFSDFFEDEGAYHLVMEYVEGGSLAEEMHYGKLPVERVLEIGLDLADALARAHRLGIIHRDVKPQNILLASDGTPRLSDFGLAYYTRSQSITLAHEPAGTLHYMPPEAFQGQVADERTDIWSLGVVLFETLAGQLPFNADNTRELIRQILSEPAPYLLTMDPDLPPTLCDLVDVMLAKRHEERIASVRLVGATLEAIRNGHGAKLPHPVVSSRQASTGKLPEPPTSFIGRKQALAEIGSLFDSPGGHLVTLTGPGGVGKTRMAVQLAQEMEHRYPDGVFFVDLAPVLAPELVLGRIAASVGLRDSSVQTVMDDIMAFLRGKLTLLLLDNFEQVVEAAPVIGNLFLGVPELDILITSREALRLSGEQLYAVRPLALPDLARDASPMALSLAESVDLFVQRAAAVQPGLRLTSQNARDIAEICVQLDGLPLAIELAAARTRILSPRFLRKELDDVFAALAEGPRDTVARQRTLRAAIDWSHDLLDDQEKMLFARLSMFKGGATFEAIDSVAMPGLTLGMISGLESLVSKSLLLCTDDAQQEPRFGYLETIHQYAQLCLEESGEGNVVRRRHADYFAGLAERVVPLLRGPGQDQFLEVIRKEYDNLRVVLTWSFMGADFQLGARLYAALADFWYYEGSTAEGERWSAEALQCVDLVPPALQVRLLNGAGLLAFSRGDHQQGRLWNQKALNIARANDDSAGAAWALFWLSAHATYVPDTYEQGIEYCREALSLFQEINDEYGLAWGNNQNGELSRLLGNYEQARSAYLHSLAICRASGNIRREAIALVNLGYTAQHQGNYAEAETFMLEGLALLYHLKLEHHAAISLATLSGPATAQGAGHRAATLLGASDAAFARLAIPYQPADRMEIDQYVSQVRQQMGNEAFQAAWSVGQAMTFDEAVAYALLGSTRRGDSRAALESQV